MTKVSIFTVFSILLYALVYICLSVFLLNNKLLIATAVGQYPIAYKFQLFSVLFVGIWSTLSHLDFFLLLVTALLVGINLYLAIQTLEILRNRKKIHLSIGGIAMVGLMSTGCATCGLSVLSLLGLSASFSFLPFHAIELHILSIMLLIASGMYMFKQLQNSKQCKI